MIVQRNAMRVWEDIQNAVQGPSFRQNIEADPDAAMLTAEQLDAIFDPRAFLTRIDPIFERLEELDFS